VMFEHEKPAVREAGWRASTRPKPDLYPVYRPYRSLPVAAEIEVMHIMTTGLSVIYWLLALILSPLLMGVINRVKAFFGGRKGRPLFQAYHDLFKLLRKDAVYSRTTTWIFRAGPIVGLAVLAAGTDQLGISSIYTRQWSTAAPFNHPRRALAVFGQSVANLKKRKPWRAERRACQTLKILKSLFTMKMDT
jgi:hypothetical protein